MIIKEQRIKQLLNGMPYKCDATMLPIDTAARDIVFPGFSRLLQPTDAGQKVFFVWLMALGKFAGLKSGHRTNVSSNGIGSQQ